MFVAQSLLLAVACVSLRAALTPEPQLSSSSSSSSDAPHSSISTDEAERLNVSTHTLSTEDLLNSTAHPSSSSSGDATGTPESWTHQQHTESVSAVSLSEDFGTDATMSTEDLPLIFEPSEDVTPAGVSVSTSTSTAEPTEAEHTTSDGQRSTSDPPDTTLAGDDVTLSSITHQNLTVQLPASTPKTNSEYQESREEPDEDEEDEELDSEEEEESEEDLSESTITPHTRPPYSLIPPPPVWVQRNQGLVRSWVELIREKAGYVSGMLAPVGIGIAGALLLVGALYSIRLIHRKRRESFKHQRKKPPREVQSGPDNTMLLADSSEDEF